MNSSLTSYFHMLAYTAKDVTGRPVHRKLQRGSRASRSRCCKVSWESSISVAVSARNSGNLKCWANARNFFTVCCRNITEHAQCISITADRTVNSDDGTKGPTYFLHCTSVGDRSGRLGERFHSYWKDLRRSGRVWYAVCRSQVLHTWRRTHSYWMGEIFFFFLLNKKSFHLNMLPWISVFCTKTNCSVHTCERAALRGQQSTSLT